MRYAGLGLIALLAACTARVDRTAAAGGEVSIAPSSPSATDLSASYDGRDLGVDARIATLGSYVKWIESRIPSTSASGALIRTTVHLPPHAFSDVTDEEWERIDAFYDGAELKRLRLIPPKTGDQGTEEFYFSEGRVVYVYYEPDGATKSDVHTESGGDAYYFGREGMIAWIRGDGSRVDPNSVDFKAMSTQLLKEAARFPRDARAP